MSAPVALPAAPAAATPAASGGTRSAAAADQAGFATALDDALAGTGGGAQQGSAAAEDDPATTDDDSAADQAAADDAAASALAVSPALWALLSAAVPTSTVPIGTPATDAGSGSASVPTTTATAAAAAAAAASGQAPGQAAIAAAVDASSGAAAEPATVPDPLPGPTSSAAEKATPAGSPGTGAARLPGTSGTGTAAGPSTGGGSASTTDVPLLVATPVTTGSSSADGDTSDGAGSDTAGEGSSLDAATTTPDTSTVFSLGTALTTTGTSAATPATGQGEPVATQLGQQLAVLVDAPDGTQTMTLVITPDELGPVSITATLSDGTMDLTLHGAHEHGRHALTDALPELRRDLESAGITVNRLEVGADAGTASGDPRARADQQQLANGWGGQQGRPGQQAATPRSWAPSGDEPGAGSAARTPDPSASSGVDIRV